MKRKEEIKDAVEGSKPPWMKKRPKGKKKKLTAKQKAKAKAKAKKAGRPYPNLVDNMNAAKKSKKGMSDEAYFDSMPG